MKTILKIIGLFLLLVVVYVVGVLGYAWLTDFQPEPETSLVVEGHSEVKLSKEDSVFTIMTWNLGFGGLGKEMDFFYDGGTTVRNTRDIFEKNIVGILQTVTDSVDFYCFQEIDIKAKRSYQFNEVQAIKDKLRGYDFVFGKNYDVGFVPRPFFEPMGNVLGGILTASRWNLTGAKAYAYKNTYPFPDYLFYLDRCFTVTRSPLSSGKELVLINSHNSAYDPGGKMKKFELEQLKAVLLTEYQKGNYVITAADWNQYPPGYKGFEGFAIDDTTAGAFSVENYPENGWQWAWDTSLPTCRDVGVVYNPKTTYRTTIDYFLLSPNLESIYVKVLPNEFDFSDHQPVLLKIKIKP